MQDCSCAGDTPGRPTLLTLFVPLSLFPPARRPHFPCGHLGKVADVAWSPLHPSLLASCSANAVSLWDLATRYTPSLRLLEPGGERAQWRAWWLKPGVSALREPAPLPSASYLTR